MQYKTTFKTIPLADIVECPYQDRLYRQEGCGHGRSFV